MIHLAKKRIVILGGGFAGQMTAVTLQKYLNDDEAEVVLVNKHNYHFITYKLHEIAAGNTTNEAVSVNINELIDTNKIQFKKGTVVAIDKDKKQVQLASEVLDYDILVACMGGQPQTFNVPGVAEHAHFIWTRNTAQAISDKMIENFNGWHADQDEARLTLVCVGAGFTGLEFLGEMVERKAELADEFSIPEEKIKIICLEAADRVLPMFPDKAVNYSVKYLQEHDIEIRLGQKIASIDEAGVNLQDGEKIHSRLVIWATGVKGNPIIHAAGFPEVGRTERVKVNEFLEVEGMPAVYVIGDASVCLDGEGKPYPQTAQLALQQGAYLGKHIVKKLRGEESKPFRLVYRGTMMSLGKVGAGVVYGHVVKGFTGHIFKVVVDQLYYYKLKGLPLVVKMFTKK